MSDQEQLLTLHGRLLAGDLRVASSIVELVIAPLVAIVTGEIVGLHDRQDVEQTCYDALLDYLERPSDYNPERAQLLTYLAVKAKGKARTLRRSQNRRTQHELDFAEMQMEHRDATMAANGEDAMLLRVERGRLRERFGHELIKDPGDADVFDLLASGENSLAVYARALGLPADPDGLKEAGKRVERIRGRIRRIGKRMEA